MEMAVNIGGHWLRFTHTFNPIATRAAWDAGHPPEYVSPEMQAQINAATQEFLDTITFEALKAILVEVGKHD